VCPGYDHLLRYLRAAQAVIASQSASFRRCYGAEYVSGKLMKWAENQGVRLEYIQPGKPQQNAYIERYKRTVRPSHRNFVPTAGQWDEWLSQYIFETIEKAQDQATVWLWPYNGERPNMGTGGITPAMKLKTAA
jgi:transposase InsO family protein